MKLFFIIFGSLLSLGILSSILTIPVILFGYYMDRNGYNDIVITISVITLFLFTISLVCTIFIKAVERFE